MQKHWLAQHLLGHKKNAPISHLQQKAPLSIKEGAAMLLKIGKTRITFKRVIYKRVSPAY